MIAPGLKITSGRVNITAGAGQAPNSINQGFGFMNDGSLAVDTNAPSGGNFINGLAVSAAGAVFGTTTASGTDVWNSGVRMSATGQLVYELAAAVDASNGNPITSNGRFAAV